MPLNFKKCDITTVVCDAIVDPTDRFYSGSGGTDLAIHAAAGRELDEACMQLPPLNRGEVASTPGFRLPCKHVIHTVGPIWEGGQRNEPMLLRSCYLNCLMKAKQLGARSVAFPLISSGTFGFPKDRVLRIATDAISDFLFSVDSELEVCICITDPGAFELSLNTALCNHLNRAQRFAHVDGASSMSRMELSARRTGDCAPMPKNAPAPDFAPAPCASAIPGGSLSDWIKIQDDTFAVMLLKLIDKKGMDDVECYKKANVTKNTFWKIRNDGKYRPSKPTVIAFAIALELTLEETGALLRSAGFALAHNNLFDMIIEFYIKNGIYDIFEINSALYQYDQQCLGC